MRKTNLRRLTMAAMMGDKIAMTTATTITEESRLRNTRSRIYFAMALPQKIPMRLST